MDNLFGIPLTTILGVLLAMGAGIVGVLALIAVRNPLLVRMGVRNIARRKTQTVLIVIGLMLSTLIISAAFATGDTVGYSITNTVYRELGQADVIVVFDRERAPVGVTGLTDADVDTLRMLLADDPDIDAISGMVQADVPALNPDARLSEPGAVFVGVDSASSDALDGLVTPGGDAVSARDLAPGEAYVSQDLVEEIQLEVGGTVTIYYENVPHDFTVAGVVQDNAMSSQAGSGPQGGGGVIVPLESLREVTQDQEINLIVVSVTGGVRDSVDLSGDVEDRLEAAFEAQGLPLRVATSKAELVGFAEFAGSLFVTFFLVFGLFSIAAGIMLIFLTFIMLAAERRAEMGMARAIGMKRLHLTESFIAEGMSYNLGSAFVGAVLGLGVAYGLITVMGNVFSDFGLSITFHVNAIGFMIAYLLGVVITFITVAIASWRAANLNIVRAIRDIPEPEPLKGKDTSIRSLALGTLGVLWLLLRIFVGVITFGLIPLLRWALTRIRPVGRLWQRFNRLAARHRSSGAWAIVMLLIGALATWWGGWISQQAFSYTAGTTLMLFAVAMLAVYFGAPTRPVFASISAITVWYWLMPLPFSLFIEDAKTWTDPVDGLFGLVGLGHDTINGNIEMFFVSGVCITAASTLFVIFNADRLLGTLGVLTKVLGGITPAIRTAISYPLAAKFRTGMTLAMFTLVVFSLVVMATLNHNFTQLFLGDTARGGFDVQVAANPNNPLGGLEEALAEGGYDVQGNIAAVGHLLAGPAEMKPANEDDEYYSYLLAGLDAGFVDAADFPMSTTANGYADSAAVLQAVRDDPTVAIANESILDFVQRQNFLDPDEIFSIEGNITVFQDAPWDPIPVTIRDAETGEERTVNIIGFVDSAIISGIVQPWLSIFVNESVAAEVLDESREFYFIQAATAGEEASIELANGIESTLLERGVQADSLRQLIADSTAQSNAFSNLFVAFMSLGLIVGIAALGVIAFRTVAERKQQIGMLRAIGYSRRLVAISFFLESSFIAVTGIGMGLILGGALSYNLMTSPEFTNGQEIDFSYPVATILIVVGVAYAATALMTLIPARSASRVAVAEALRYSA